MNSIISAGLRRLLAPAFIFGALAQPALRAADAAAPMVAQPAVNAPVTVTDDGANLDAGQRHHQADGFETHRQTDFLELQWIGNDWPQFGRLGAISRPARSRRSLTIDPAQQRRRTRRGCRERRERPHGHRSALHLGTRRQRILHLRHLLSRSRLSRRRRGRKPLHQPA